MRSRLFCVLVAAGVAACGDSGEQASDSAEESGGATGETGDGETGDGDGDGETGDGDGETGDGDALGCEPLGEPPPEGPIVSVVPADANALPQMVLDAEPNTTFSFADGTYDLSQASLLHVTQTGLRFVGESRDRDAVILDAGYGLGEIFLVEASNTTIAHMTVQRAFYHPIHVTGGPTSNTEATFIYDVAVIDPGQQAIKINSSGEGYHSDHGTVACSLVRMTDAGRGEVTDCYTGGIDAHSAWGWSVRDNYFEGFWCEEGLSEHAVHFWVTGRDTIVERNTIVDCARGVGFGLGAGGNGNQRIYEDDPCPGADYLGHVDGEIRNNFVFASRPELFASQSGFDSGVALEQACGARVFHNTVFSTQPPFVSMEYRFPNTDAQIVNNLVSHDIVQRDEGSAELVANIEGAGAEEFLDAMGGDLRLDPGSSAIAAGDPSALAWTSTDIHGDVRSDPPDVGADEL